MPFAEISAEAAYQLLGDDPAAVLVDVRTPEEWNLVGVPVLDEFGKQVRQAMWTEYGTGRPNPSFLDEALGGLAPETTVLFLCRSGVRSRAAATAAEQAGFAATYNVTAGFEGDLDESGHRDGGWKHVGLPWRQG